jgi:CheY-like chemotaxis protein
MLESLGYAVTAMIDSRDALELFQNTPHDYDLLISDFAMPDLTGDQLAAQVTGIRQDMPVVLISGYTNEIDEQKSKRAGIKAIIQKPFVREELSRAIQSVLDGK